MSVQGRRFEVDRAEGKLLGVCAGLANTTGLDVTLVRVGTVLTALIFNLFWTVAFYVVLGIIGSGVRSRGVRSRAVRRRASRPEREEARDRVRDLDLRMQAIETYVTSSNSRLAREIEELR